MKRYYLGAAVLVLLAIIAGVANGLVSKPYVADRMAVQDLRSLDEAILSYDRANDALPTTLTTLKISSDLKKRLRQYEYTQNSPRVQTKTVPAQTKMGIPYYPLPTDSFTLCATFRTDTTDLNKQAQPYPERGFSPEYHGKGRQCFTDEAPQPVQATQ